MNYAVNAPTRPVVPVLGDEAVFPVRRIWCIGRNYADHALEMGHDPRREQPLFFAKPGDAVAPGGGTLPFPSETNELHHEIEMVVAIGESGSSIPAKQALLHVFGYAVGLDMTRRDLQNIAKTQARPWEFGKSFDLSCPISAISPVRLCGHPETGRIELSVNGEPRQVGDIGQMIWPVAEAIAYLSRFVALAAGDLIMTGTPSGVGRVLPGDLLQGRCEGIGEIEVRYETTS